MNPEEKAAMNRSVAEITARYSKPNGAATVKEVDSNTVSFNVAPNPLRWPSQSSGEFTKRKSTGWHIKKHWPMGAFTLEIGESGAGKTFSVLDKAAAVARGVTWRDLRVKRGRVRYVCAEGGGGFRNRVRAYEAEHGTFDPNYFRVIDASPNLYDSAQDRADLEASLDASGPFDVLILDTVAATSPGANENTSDMLAVTNYYTHLIRKYGCSVVGVHHLGKDVTRGARGFSGIKAAADAEITTENTGGVRTVYVSKMKDGAEGEKYHFTLKVVVIELDDDGDEITSCVVDYDTPPPTTRQVVARPVGDYQKASDAAMTELSPTGTPVSVAALDQLAASKVDHPEMSEGRLLEYVRRARGSLCDKRVFVAHGTDRVGRPILTEVTE